MWRERGCFLGCSRRSRGSKWADDGRGWMICFGSYTGSSAADSDEELGLL